MQNNYTNYILPITMQAQSVVNRGFLRNGEGKCETFPLTQTLSIPLIHQTYSASHRG